MDFCVHLFERVFGHNGDVLKVFRQNNYVEALKIEGFSDAEAQNLAWLYQHKDKGRAFGILLGVTTCYCSEKWLLKLAPVLPSLHYSKATLWGVRLGVIFASWSLFDYFFIGRRIGGNNAALNTLLWNNLRFTHAQEGFIQNFDVMNRKFTQTELAQFSVRQKTLEQNFERRWIYNPAVHGEDEAGFWHEVKSKYQQKVAPWERKDVQQQILNENKEKLEHGEVIKFKPYDLTQNVDPSGVKNKLKLNPAIHSWQPIL